METIKTWEDENLIPTKTQLELIASMGKTTINEIIWNEKPDSSVIMLKNYNEKIDIINLTEEENLLAQVLFERFLTIRNLIIKDLDSSEILRDIFDSLLDGITYNQNSDDNNGEQLINTLISEYQRLLEITK